MKTLRICLVPLLIAFGLFQQGCQTSPVGRAQQVTHAAAVDFHAFLVFEKQNRDALRKINPAIKHTADRIRHKECEQCDQNGIRWLNTAISTIDAYKDNRTPEKKANMQTAIAVIQELIDQIADYFLINAVRNLDPATAAKYPKTKVVP